MGEGNDSLSILIVISMSLSTTVSTYRMRYTSYCRSQGVPRVRYISRDSGAMITEKTVCQNPV